VTPKASLTSQDSIREEEVSDAVSKAGQDKPDAAQSTSKNADSSKPVAVCQCADEWPWNMRNYCQFLNALSVNKEQLVYHGVSISSWCCIKYEPNVSR
jgi:hypothetical protein